MIEFDCLVCAKTFEIPVCFWDMAVQCPNCKNMLCVEYDSYENSDETDEWGVWNVVLIKS